MKKFEIFQNYKNMTETLVSKRCWENGTNGLAPCRVATDFQLVKNAISVKHHKVKCSKMRCVCNCR